MNASPKPSKVVVIGGGIFGVSTSVHLARLGIATVLVNDGRLANGASGRSLAWLNSARKRSGAITGCVSPALTATAHWLPAIRMRRGCASTAA